MMNTSSSDIPTFLLRTLECKQGAVRAVRFNVDGNYCLTCGSDKSVKLWNPYKCLFLKSYNGHGYEVLDARSSCDNGQIASCGLDKSIIIWDVSTGVPLKKYRGHAGTVNCIAFNEDSSVVASASIDGTVKLWDCKSHRKEPIQTLSEAQDSVTSVQVSDHEILSGSADCQIRRYDIRNGKLFADYVGQPLTSINFTRDDTSVFSGSEDGQVYCWDLIESNLRTTLKHPGCRVVHSISFHPTRGFLLTAAEGHVFLWGTSEKLDVDDDDAGDSS